MSTYTKEQLAEVIRLHGMWLANKEGGAGADLSGANLSGADLYGANLSGVRGNGTTGITLITIHLSPYSLTYRSDTNSIHIGCKLLTVPEWLGKAGKEVAEGQRFTANQYKKYMIAIRALRRLSTCKQ